MAMTRKKTSNKGWINIATSASNTTVLKVGMRKEDQERVFEWFQGGRFMKQHANRLGSGTLRLMGVILL